MATQTTLPFMCAERSSRLITWQFQQPDGTALDNDALETLTVTLYDVTSDMVLNGRETQDILGVAKSGQNNFTLDGTGNVIWYMQPDDNAVLDATRRYEAHIALFEWSWDPGDGNGVREDRTEIPILVKNLHLVPTPVA